MAKRLDTEILIDAPAERVWSVLMEFAAYPEWNPFIQQIQGEAKVGTTLTVTMEPPKKNKMTFQPKVLVVKENTEFRWLGHTVFPGLFDGEHVFQLEKRDNGTCFIQREKFRGMLVPLIMAMIGSATRNGFEEMNQALKERVEQLDGSSDNGEA
ncbi:SRPBCC domain-containing protein [bacterium]|nr:SRPBCC domain-containing protein [bacterium]